MRFWFEHSSEVSLRDQVVTQVSLGILCGELAPGERLPSVRELARRFGLHANTVSAGYQQLESEGWVESRRGSGVYIRETRPAGRLGKGDGLARLITNLFEGARRLGVSDTEVVAWVQVWSGRAAVERVLLVEPDVELRRIVMAELAEAVDLPVKGCGFGECADLLAGALVVVLPSKLETVRAEVRASGIAGVRVAGLRVRSVTQSLAEHLPTARDGVLIGIASSWSEFVRFAHTMLVAAGFDGESLVVRDAHEADWQHGLDQTAGVVCDLVTAAAVPPGKAIIFRILAEGVAAEIAALHRSDAISGG